MAKTLKAQHRTKTGTRSARQYRKQNLIPGVVYGHGQAPLSVALDAREAIGAVHHGDRLLELDFEGTKENVLVKEVQYDAFQQDIIHIDLARVNLDERVRVTVPIVLRGTPVGAGDGGVIAQTAAQVEIEVLVTAIPDDIRASVVEMKLGDVMHFKDLPLPEGAKLVTDGELIVCSCTLVAEEVVAAPEEGAAAAAAGEPEVIGAKKEEEEAAGEAAPAPKKEKKE